MGQYTVGRMWHLVCIRKCVGGRWSVEGRCRAEVGDALDVSGGYKCRAVFVSGVVAGL